MSPKIELASLVIGRSTLSVGFKKLRETPGTSLPAPPQVRKPSSLKEFRRSAILDAATRVFGDKGYDETRMDDVAAAAALSKATVYAYFDSKDEIFVAAVERCLQEITDLTTPRVEAATDFPAKLNAFLITRLSYWGDRLALYRVIVTLKRESHNLKRSLRWQRPTIYFLMVLFQHAMQAGDIPEQPFEPAAWALMDMIRGLLERRMAHPNSSIEQEAAELTAFMLRALGYKRPATTP
ncbi:transcriptional regulator, TetR family [Bryocella elongata]|uniref:Transcriptional regulator, TetR family n=1 Tax=Bryocella elongata TaxID=863522 RepID=A0A1H5S9S0_9BACT|nr:transcriptional regulator, TetR family [Bryocella elongata]